MFTFCAIFLTLTVSFGIETHSSFSFLTCVGITMAKNICSNFKAKWFCFRVQNMERCCPSDTPLLPWAYTLIGGFRNQLEKNKHDPERRRSKNRIWKWIKYVISSYTHTCQIYSSEKPLLHAQLYSAIYHVKDPGKLIQCYNMSCANKKSVFLVYMTKTAKTT